MKVKAGAKVVVEGAVTVIQVDRTGEVIGMRIESDRVR
jgi:hypothetical protein